ncbi:ubiquitin-protein ligase [Lithospermum erythrorhizon]|uniref:RING-type E3 ubiquitin transferase n=1 Tax=Lithospermum erythrorhizon TaxID=34254 RepID=A0AAV3QFB8_LITER
MASSENESTSAPQPSTRSTSAPPSLEELSRSLLLPYIIGLISTSPPQHSISPLEVLVLVNFQTGSITMVEGSGSGGKEGPLPASKASIEAMRKVEVREEEGVVECPICLVEFGEEVVREMPCMHKYHGRCIEKWLGIHGSCPLCRYQMPVQDEGQNDIKNGINEEEEDSDGDERVNGAGFIFHVYVAHSRTSESDPDTIHAEDNSGSASDMDIDSSN